MSENKDMVSVLVRHDTFAELVGMRAMKHITKTGEALSAADATNNNFDALIKELMGHENAQLENELHEWYEQSKEAGTSLSNVNKERIKAAIIKTDTSIYDIFTCAIEEFERQRGIKISDSDKKLLVVTILQSPHPSGEAPALYWFEMIKNGVLEFEIKSGIKLSEDDAAFLINAAYFVITDEALNALLEDDDDV